MRPSKASRAAIRMAVTILEQQHTKFDLGLNEVAAQVRLSPSHLSRLLREQTGKGFREHLNSLRLSTAETLLRNPLLSVKEVAAASGFRSVSTFDRYFRRIHERTPSEWRSDVLENPEHD